MTDRGTLSRLKLAEAKFFLDQLRPNYNKERKFDFFLSAFISAARSVTWIMRSEYGEVGGWEAWFNALEPSGEEAALLQGTNEVRIRTQKREPLRTMARLVVDRIIVPEDHATRIAEALAKSPDGQLPAHVGGTKGNYFAEVELEGDRFRFPVTNVVVERNLKEFPGENILTVCEAYYYLALQALVRECGAKFDP